MAGRAHQAARALDAVRAERKGHHHNQRDPRRLSSVQECLERNASHGLLFKLNRSKKPRMKIERFAVFDRSVGAFLADRGGHSLRLHEIRIFADKGEAERNRRLSPTAEIVPCEGLWCAEYGVDTHA